MPSNSAGDLRQRRAVMGHAGVEGGTPRQQGFADKSDRRHRAMLQDKDIHRARLGYNHLEVPHRFRSEDRANRQRTPNVVA